MMCQRKLQLDSAIHEQQEIVHKTQSLLVMKMNSHLSLPKGRKKLLMRAKDSNLSLLHLSVKLQWL